MSPLISDAESVKTTAGLSEAYRWLGQMLLAELTTEEVAEFVAGEVELARPLLGDRPRLAEARAILTEVQAELQGQSEDEASHLLAAEYATLFVGPHRNRVAPYESVHAKADDGSETIGGPLLMGEPVVVMRGLMKRAGVAPLNPRNLPEDHVGFELAFVGWLLSDEGEQVGADQAALLSLVVDRLAAWLPIFALAVRAQAPRSFYDGVTQLALGLVEDHAGSH